MTAWDMVKTPIYYYESEHVPMDKLAYGITTLAGTKVILINPANTNRLRAQLPGDFILVEWNPDDPDEREAFHRVMTEALRMRNAHWN